LACSCRMIERKAQGVERESGDQWTLLLAAVLAIGKLVAGEHESLGTAVTGINQERVLDRGEVDANLVQAPCHRDTFENRLSADDFDDAVAGERGFALAAIDLDLRFFAVYGEREIHLAGDLNDSRGESEICFFNGAVVPLGREVPLGLGRSG